MDEARPALEPWQWPEEQWRRITGANVDGAFLGCKAAIEAMPEGGAIVNVVAARGSLAGAASGGAVRMLSKNVALRCGVLRLPIRCNSVRVAEGRSAKEAAALISFLVSSEAGFITGAEHSL